MLSHSLLVPPPHNVFIFGKLRVHSFVYLHVDEYTSAQNMNVTYWNIER
jgi:hypothetical protein